MCGIAGVFGIDALPRASIEAMTACLAHRGPDGTGVWLDPDGTVALGHRRLAILDPSEAGAQPMVSDCGRWVVVFNGEIYNHRALRAELERQGRAPSWRGHSDTESLLAAIAAWGPKHAARASVGMFAWAVWDRIGRTLTFARDRLGEKPLALARVRGGLAFASETSALRAHPGFDPRLDPHALAAYLRFGTVQSPHSIHRDAAHLPAGCCLTVPLDARGRVVPGPLRPERYWSLARLAHDGHREPFTGSPEQAVQRLENLLTEAVDGQRVADRPLGAFLSGGVDSSLVTAILQRQSAGPVNTFCVGFDDPAHDERSFARAVAARLGTRHEELCLTAGEAARWRDRLSAVYDEPFADSSQLPSLALAHLARSRVVVALTGDGGDELFQGYDRYRHAARVQALMRAPASVRKPLARLLWRVPARAWDGAARAVSAVTGRASVARPGDALHKLARVLASQPQAVHRALLAVNAESDAWLSADVLAGLNHADEACLASPGDPGGVGATSLGDELLSGLRSEEVPEAPPGIVERAMLADGLGYLPDDLLVKVDRAAMAHGLETRVPLLDHRIVEFAWQLPASVRTLDGHGKWPLRALLARVLPDGLPRRPKMGFGVPLADWLRGPWREWAEHGLSEARLRRLGVVDVAAVRNAWQRHLEGRESLHHALWPVLMLDAWTEAP